MEPSGDRLTAWLRLVRTAGVGPVLGARLVSRLGGVEQIFTASDMELLHVEGLKEETMRSLRDGAIAEAAARELEYCRAEGIAVVALDDPAYPAALKEIYDPPLALYVKGEWPAPESERVAVVGTRSPDVYGESMAAKIGSGLARLGVTVVSGMARGVDGIAQAAAVKAGGKSVAVLGTGVDVPYPKENADLYRSLVQSGAVVSEYPPGTEPAPGNFPRRNRIVSGLSRGVVMVQAMSERSGALITVRLALEHNREVFVVPGNAGGTGGRVANKLIKDGARLVETAEDVALHLRPLGSVPLVSDAETASRDSGRRLDLPDRQARVFALVPAPAEGAIEVGDLARQAGAPAAELQGDLLELELAGLVRALPGARYVRIE